LRQYGFDHFVLSEAKASSRIDVLAVVNALRAAMPPKNLSDY
jgi:hypothetical protein